MVRLRRGSRLRLRGGPVSSSEGVQVVAKRGPWPAQRSMARLRALWHGSDVYGLAQRFMARLRSLWPGSEVYGPAQRSRASPEVYGPAQRSKGQPRGLWPSSEVQGPAQRWSIAGSEV